MRRLLKFLHEIGSAGIIGAIVAHISLLLSARHMSAVEYAAVRHSIDALSRWLLMPSLAIVLISGFLAMAVHAPFHNAGWAWIKALMGVMMLEGTLGAIQGTARDAAALSARIARGEIDGDGGMKEILRHEWGGLWFILALCAVNVALAVWRPKLSPKPAKVSSNRASASPPQDDR